MKKWILVLLAMVLMFVITGCAMFQKSITDVAKQDATNAQATRLAAREIGSTWALNSGFLTPALQTLKGLIPCDCESDIKTLDGIAAKCTKRDTNGNLTCEELTDTDCGTIVWYWGKTWGSIVKSGAQQLLQTFFPSVLTKILPYVTALGL